MKIENYGIRVLNSTKACSSAFGELEESTIRCVYMEPELFLLCHHGKVLQRVDCPSIGRARICCDAERYVPCRAVLCDHGTQSRQVHAYFVVCRDTTKCIGRE